MRLEQWLQYVEAPIFICKEHLTFPDNNQASDVYGLMP